MNRKHLSKPRFLRFLFLPLIQALAIVQTRVQVVNDIAYTPCRIAWNLNLASLYQEIHRQIQISLTKASYSALWILWWAPTKVCGSYRRHWGAKRLDQLPEAQVTATAYLNFLRHPSRKSRNPASWHSSLLLYFTALFLPHVSWSIQTEEDDQ